MSEIEAIMRLIVGAAMVDGRIDADELERLRGVAQSVGASRVMRRVMVRLPTSAADHRN